MYGLEALYYPDFEPPASWLRAFLLIFDKIRTVVPEGVEPRLSDEVREVIEHVPGALEPVPPQPADTHFESWNMARLRAAFKHIRASSESGSGKITLRFDEEGSVSIEGHTFLHDLKMSHAVRDLLQEYRLILPEMKPLAENLGVTGFSVVSRPAADMIVSLVADRVGRRNAWNTVTDRKADFIVNSLNFIDRTSPNGAAIALASSIVRCVIPSQVADIDIRLYRDIRNQYTDLRGALARSVVSLAQIKSLETIKDAEILGQHIRELSEILTSEVEKLERSTLGRSIRKWTPVGIAAIGSLAGAYTQQLGWGVAGGVSVGLGFKIIEQFVGHKEYESEEHRIHRLLGNLQHDILTAAEVRWAT